MLLFIVKRSSYRLWFIGMVRWRIMILLINILWRLVRKLRRGFVPIILRCFIWIIMGIVIRILLCIVGRRLGWLICSSIVGIRKDSLKHNIEPVWPVQWNYSMSQSQISVQYTHNIDFDGLVDIIQLITCPTGKLYL